MTFIHILIGILFIFSVNVILHKLDKSTRVKREKEVRSNVMYRRLADKILNERGRK